jgi:hypothetical protein
MADWNSTVQFFANTIQQLTITLGLLPTGTGEEEHRVQTTATRLGKQPSEHQRQGVNLPELANANDIGLAVANIASPARDDTGSHESSTQDNEHKTPSPSPLLRLPGELRNAIYRLALVEEEGNRTLIQNTTHGILEPGLLLANRQLRHEARPMYYFENSFDLPIANYNPVAIVPFNNITRNLEKHYDDKNLKLNKPRLRFVDGRECPDWHHIMTWLEHFHAGRADIMFRGSDTIETDPGTADKQSVELWFLLAASLRERPWSEIRADLDRFKPLLDRYYKMQGASSGDRVQVSYSWIAGFVEWLSRLGT